MRANQHEDVQCGSNRPANKLANQTARQQANRALLYQFTWLYGLATQDLECPRHSACVVMQLNRFVAILPVALTFLHDCT